MKKLFTKIINHLFYTPNRRQAARKHIKDVKPGESIAIEWSRIKGTIGTLRCINNDPETRQILLEITWGNYKAAGIEQKESIILHYSCDQLKNFHLLNSHPTLDKPQWHSDIASLKNYINDLIEKEEYEKVTEVHQKILTLLNKPDVNT